MSFLCELFWHSWDNTDPTDPKCKRCGYHEYVRPLPLLPQKPPAPPPTKVILLSDQQVREALANYIGRHHLAAPYRYDVVINTLKNGFEITLTPIIEDKQD